MLTIINHHSSAGVRRTLSHRGNTTNARCHFPLPTSCSSESYSSDILMCAHQKPGTRAASGRMMSSLAHHYIVISYRSRGCAPLAHTDGRTGEHVDNYRPLSHRGNTTNTRCHFPLPVPLTAYSIP